VFSELLLGHSNKEISFNMNISINTVKVHIHNIFKKLNIKKRNEILLIKESESNLTIAST
jgi:DNA-binding NarL/FixJ family response regulator